MYDKTPHETDLMIIGTGMAGMAAAVFACQKGIRVAQAGVTGELLYATGLLDVMGVHPIAEKKVWTNPWEAIDRLKTDMPRHPYAKLSVHDIQSAMNEFIDFFSDSPLPYRTLGKANVLAITPVGTTKSTFAVPTSMWEGVTSINERRPCLIVDFKGLKGFSARQIAQTLGIRLPGTTSHTLTFPTNATCHELYPEQMARLLEMAETRERLAEQVKPVLKNARAVGFPAILGMYSTETIIQHLTALIGAPVFEIPTMPPAIPGIRMKEFLDRKLYNLGVTQYLQKRVRLARQEADGTFLLGIGETGTQHTVKAKGIVLATGRFIGQGLHAGRRRIRETLFDLPVTQPPGRAEWHQDTFFDVRGHAINLCGIETDTWFRPLDSPGKPAFDNLFAAGSILAHQDWIRMKCGSGLAIATAWGAVNSFLKLS